VKEWGCWYLARIPRWSSIALRSCPKVTKSPQSRHHNHMGRIQCKHKVITLTYSTLTIPSPCRRLYASYSSESPNRPQSSILKLPTACSSHAATLSFSASPPSALRLTLTLRTTSAFFLPIQHLQRAIPIQT
jgi:hypothetical protein